MNDGILRRISACFILVIVLLVSLDAYIPTRPTLCVFSQDYVDISKSSVGYYVVSSNGIMYPIPPNTDMALGKGDTFYVDRTAIFGKMWGLTYPGPGKRMKTLHYGPMHSILGYILVALALAISIPNLGKKKGIKDSELNTKLLIGGVGVAIIGGYVYFF